MSRIEKAFRDARALERGTPPTTAGSARQAELLREALEAMQNLAPRVKDYGGCFGRMAGGGGADCECTACKIRRELTPTTHNTGDER